MKQKRVFVTRESLLPPLKKRIKCSDIDISRLRNIQIDADQYYSLEHLKEKKRE